VSQLVFDEKKVQELRKTSHERKETYEMGNPYPNGESAPNRWLAEEHLPGWRAFVEKWWDECTKLERSMLKFLGQVLELEDDELLCKRQSRDLNHMSWAFYPSMPIAPLKNRQLRRLNAHTDFGGLTLLFQDMVGGLEIHDGQVFKPVVPKRGTVVLNVGDMLERQSNGRWKSGLHQVTAPSEANMEAGFKSHDAVVDRYSIIYFGQPDPESLVDTLPGCESRGKWKPNMIGEWDEIMTSQEWLQKRLAFEY
jgi:isopenicillin N synthase-like dioxygenase